MDITGKKKIEIFCCYAREDQELLLAFRKHLKPLEQQGFIAVWSDIDINGGAEWEKEIKKHLNSAQIILLFVSPDFMQSDYCYSTEMSRAMERHEYGEVRVIPIILRPTSWRRTPFGKLQVLPANAEPVTGRSWHTLDDALLNVTEGIEKGVDELLAQSLTAVPLPQPANVAHEQRLQTSTATDSGAFDKFTLRALNVLSLAQKEAGRFQHNYIGTEHLLLGLVSDGEGVVAKFKYSGPVRNGGDVATKVLANLGVELNVIRRDVEFLLRPGKSIVQGEIGLTPRAKKIIELAVDEIRLLHLDYLGTEHLLLGMIREGEGIAGGVLANLGVNLEKARAQTIQILGLRTY